MTKHFVSSKGSWTRNEKMPATDFCAMALAALLLLAGGGCGGTETPKPATQPAAEAKPVAPAIPDDIQDAAKTLLGSDATVLLVGDLAKNGKKQFLAANVVPKTPKNNVPGTVITRAVVAEEDNGKWTELLRCDEHLKNAKGIFGFDATGFHHRLEAAI